VRLGRRTKRLLERLRPGDVAVVDHRGIDPAAAEALVARGVRCVVNAAESCSPRHPSRGAQVLVDAGVTLVDAVGTPLFEDLTDGQPVVVQGGRVWSRGELVAEGEVVGSSRIADALAASRAGIAAALEDFADKTTTRLAEELDLVIGGFDVPALTTRFAHRPALVVARGPGVAEDLRALARYVRAERPALVAVDGGADSLLAAGFRPDVIVGDMDSASDQALLCGAEVVVHAYTDGRAPGAERVGELGLSYATFPVAGTSEDAAVTLAAECGADPIVTLGSPAGLFEMLERDRTGMASSFLTRLRLGDRLIDARGVGRLALR
jgi:uncharacterized membrane-anchored protein